MSITSTIVIAFTLCYTLSLFLLSRRRRPHPLSPPDSLFFVFVVPCLNEELVIKGSLDRLFALAEENFAVLVIDDGSDDGTARVVRQYPSDRLWLLQRTLPEARNGKGEALNMAYRHLSTSDLLEGRRRDQVVVVVLDADGRIEPNALREVAPYFADPRTAAVQIGVRMYNRQACLLARMQDMEFVTFTELFQRARQRLGSVGLGGNGQFTRLSALESLGPAPWTRALTEDLDLGIQLITKGWLNGFCPTTWVSQQAVTSARRLVRQRSRWYQGHLQCWRRLPLILRSRLPVRSVVDLTFHLVAASLVLVMTFPTLGFIVALVTVAITNPGQLSHAFLAHHGALIFFAYLLAFGMSPLYATLYWLREDSLSFPQALALAHVFNLYGYIWLPAAWLAAWKMAAGQKGWAKTARTFDSQLEIATEANA